MPLTDIAIRKAKPTDVDRKLADIGGLYLLVKANGSKLWRYDYRFAAKRKTFALGSYPLVSLQAAREAHTEARKKLAAGIDPSQERKAEALAARHANLTLFGSVRKAWMDDLESSGSYGGNTLWKKAWMIDTYVMPVLAKRPIGEIRPSEIVGVLRAIEKLGQLETARRCRQNISSIFRFAILKDLCQGDPTVAMRGLTKAPVVRHHPAIIHEASFGKLLRAIEGYNSLNTRLALAWLAETFCRPVEMRLATWDEIDLEDAVWRIPASRMKMRRPHDVPLTSGARRILRATGEANGRQGIVFPSPYGPKVKTRVPLSEGTLIRALKRLGYHGKHSPHGFRSSASTILNTRKFREDVIEFQLAHFEEGTVRKVYNRSEYWDERVEMMKAWTGLLAELREKSTE